MSLKTTSRLPWSDPTVYGLLITSIVSLLAFLAVESWVTQPVMPLSLLARRTSGFVAFNNFIIAVLSFSVLYNVPLVRAVGALCTAYPPEADLPARPAASSSSRSSSARRPTRAATSSPTAA